MFSRRLELAAIALAVATFASSAARADQPQSRAASAVAASTSAAVLQGFEDWPAGVVDIRSKSGHQWFKVLVADSPERQERGLMFVTQLPTEVGMVFPQDPPQVVRMWMKNTLIPLDMLFLGANHRVLYIRENAPVESLDIITSENPATAVLELAGGESARRGIRVGDQFHATGIDALK